MPKINKYYLECIKIMKKVNESNCEIAQKLGVTEGTIRYHLKKASADQPDKRRLKKSSLTKYYDVIENWINFYQNKRHRARIKSLYITLVNHHGYKNSYKAVVRYCRKYFPDYFHKPWCIRIETPPGKLSQIDWKESLPVQMGHKGKWVKIHALVM